MPAASSNGRHLVPSGDALRISYLALREMAAGLLYRVVDRR